MFILSANIILAQCAIVPFYAPNGVSRWRRMSGESPQVTRPAFTALKPFWWLNNLLLTVSPLEGGQQNFSAGVNSLPSALATSAWVIAPRQTLSPALKAGSSFIAF